MDSSFREEGSETRQNTKSSFGMLRQALGIIKWLAGFFILTVEEQEQAFIVIVRETNKYRSTAFALLPVHSSAVISNCKEKNK